MKAKLEQLYPQGMPQFFLFNEVRVPAFEFSWHHQPEYELILIVKGSGKRLMGDSYEQFKAGDLVLLSPHVPHTWVSEKANKDQYKAFVIDFSKTFIELLFQYFYQKDPSFVPMTHYVFY